MKKWFTKSISERKVAVVFVAMTIFAAGAAYWVSTATDNLAAR